MESDKSYASSLLWLVNRYGKVWERALLVGGITTITKKYHNSEEQLSELCFVILYVFSSCFYFRDHKLGLIATLGSCRVKFRLPQTEQTDKGHIQARWVWYEKFPNLFPHLNKKDISLIPEISSFKFVFPLRCGVVLSRRYIIHRRNIASTSRFTSDISQYSPLGFLWYFYIFHLMRHKIACH